jgi:hypothetical protein
MATNNQNNLRDSNAFNDDDALMACSLGEPVQAQDPQPQEDRRPRTWERLWALAIAAAAAIISFYGLTLRPAPSLLEPVGPDPDGLPAPTHYSQPREVLVHASPSDLHGCAARSALCAPPNATSFQLKPRG